MQIRRQLAREWLERERERGGGVLNALAAATTVPGLPADYTNTYIIT